MGGILLLLVLAASTFVVDGQSRPDFSGTWISDAVKNAPMVERGLAAQYEKRTVAQSEGAVTFASWAGRTAEEVAERSSPGMKTICSFGGAPAENIRPMRPETCSARWEGASLVTTITVPKMGSFPGRVVTATYSLEGGQLKIASVWVGDKRFESVTFWSKAK
jgi:hypothetical protein